MGTGFGGGESNISIGVLKTVKVRMGGEESKEEGYNMRRKRKRRSKRWAFGTEPAGRTRPISHTLAVWGVRMVLLNLCENLSGTALAVNHPGRK